VSPPSQANFDIWLDGRPQRNNNKKHEIIANTILIIAMRTQNYSDSMLSAGAATSR
jgi:hypothetical protein